MNKKSSPCIAADGDWQAESDMNTLARAVEIKRDPKRLAAAQAYAKKKLTEIAVVVASNPPEK